MTAVGVFLYLLHRHDEKAERELELKKHAIENGEGVNSNAPGELQKLRIGDSREKEKEHHPEALEKLKASLVLSKELKDPDYEDDLKFVEAYEVEVGGKE